MTSDIDTRNNNQATDFQSYGGEFDQGSRNNGRIAIEPNTQSTSFQIVSDDTAGTIFTVTQSNGETVNAEIDENNHLVIDGVKYGEVDDDTLDFHLSNGKLIVMHDGRELKGYIPIDVDSSSGMNIKLDDLSKSTQNGNLTFQNLEGHSTTSDHNAAPTPTASASTVPTNNTPATTRQSTQTEPPVEASNNAVARESDGTITFSEYLSQSMEGNSNGLQQQKFQYGHYDSSDVSTVRTWEEVLATGVVTENDDGSVTLTSSEDTPRVQFYPDDADDNRVPTKTSDLRDVKFDMSIDGWEEGEAAWIYELHQIGDGQAMAIGFTEEGNMMLANGNTHETDISLVDAGGISISYEGNVATVTVYNKDGSERGSETVEVTSDEVHVKGIEVYNRRSAPDTSVSVTFNNFSIT